MNRRKRDKLQQEAIEELAKLSATSQTRYGPSIYLPRVDEEEKEKYKERINRMQNPHLYNNSNSEKRASSPIISFPTLVLIAFILTPIIYIIHGVIKSL